MLSKLMEFTTYCAYIEVQLSNRIQEFDMFTILREQ